MWLIQSGALLELPDDAPVPPGSVAVDLPEDFFESPDVYRVHARTITRLPEEQVEQIRAQRAAARFSKDEIAQLKRALAEGRL